MIYNIYNISRYSYIICSRSIGLSLLKIRFVSSANNIILTLLEIIVISLICILKIIVVPIPILVEHHNCIQLISSDVEFAS